MCKCKEDLKLLFDCFSSLELTDIRHEVICDKCNTTYSIVFISKSNNGDGNNNSSGSTIKKLKHFRRGYQI
jgi:hypothetical protein